MPKRAVIMVFLLLSPTLVTAAAIDPSFKFKTMETEHFVIHLHQGLEGLALRAAEIAEDAHSVLSPSLGWQPEGKTQMVLLDRTDFANGLATVLPYNIIYIYPIPPMAGTSIGRYEDWLKTVIYHEYAHILTMDPVRGYAKTMRQIFGRTLPGGDPLSTSLFLFSAPPNIFMPYWWIEGAATWAETEYAPMGRGKSSYYEMIFRMAAAQDNIPAVDRINGDIPFWPSGNIPYIYGYALQEHISEKYGVDSVGKLSLAHSGRAPFFINDPPFKLTGRRYELLYGEAISKLKKSQTEKMKTLQSEPFTPVKMLPIDGELLTNPRFSKDGRLIAIERRDPHRHQDIVIHDGKHEVKSIRRRPSDHNLTWSPDGTSVCYTQAELRRGLNLYQDIYCYDLERNREARLTKNLRLKDIDLSPDGTAFAIVKVETERQNLALLPASAPSPAREEPVALTGFSGGRLSGPRWSPSGGGIVFSRRDDEGNTAIYIYGLKNGALEKILEDQNDNISPTWSPDGLYIIFSSDITGVYNLFAYSLEKKTLYQITHLSGGAFEPDVSESRIVFSSYGSKGFDIAEIDYRPSEWKEDIGPSIKRTPPYPPLGKGGMEGGYEINSPASGASGELKPYSAYPTLLPRFWLPTFQLIDSESLWGVFTAGRDVLGYHTYTANAGYGSKGGHYDINYYYDRLVPTLRARAYRKPVDSENSLIFEIIQPFDRVESSYRLHLGYQIRRFDHTAQRDNLFLGLDFSNTLRYPYSISDEEGHRFSLVVKDYAKYLGNDIGLREYTAAYGQFLSLGRHHVLFAELRAGISDRGVFDLGGIAGDDADFPLRGYPKGVTTGRNASTLTAEYRFPMKYIMRGIGTDPLFLDRLYGALFVDSGAAWDNDLKADNILTGIGAELRIDTVMGYKLRVSPTLGIARGISRGGETQVYMTAVIAGF